jgi:hypothetical protein
VYCHANNELLNFLSTGGQASQGQVSSEFTVSLLQIQTDYSHLLPYINQTPEQRSATNNCSIREDSTAAADQEPQLALRLSITPKL